jgi:thioredoxin-like negative regulator of GroEL
MQTYLPDFEKSCSSSHFELVRINVDLPQNQKAASHFGVRAVPTISVLNDKGAELVHLVGFQTPSRLREAARTVTQLACAKQELLTPSAGEEKFSLPSDKNACNVGVAC